jgi:glycosyltransferase involved in cell wall biosynthesis
MARAGLIPEGACAAIAGTREHPLVRGALITIAIPTLEAGQGFQDVLDAVTAQRVDAAVDLIVCDSGSTDGTQARARECGARVLEIPKASFSHGGTRNLLMSEARGTHVAFLTQDAVPADPGWLAAMLRGFSVTDNVGLVFGPYRARPEASLSVRRELETWFGSLSPDGRPRIDSVAADRRDAPPRSFWGPLGYFTDANGCIARAAWERVPFRPVAYAEDHLLAQDMLRAGYAKVYVPGAAVVHSHDYSAWEWLRRSFDEARAVAEVYGEAPSATWRDLMRNLRGNVAADVRRARAESGSRAAIAQFARSLEHHGARSAGTVLGARAATLPGSLARRVSLEQRG